MSNTSNTYTHNGLYVEWHRSREGPSFFSVAYKGSSRIITTVKQMKAVLGPAKFLQSSKDLYEWIEQKLNTVKPKEELDMDRIRTEGFGPEAHEQEPQEKTKMIT